MAKRGLPERVRERLDALGMSARAASLATSTKIGKPKREAIVQNILAGKSKSPQADTMLALAEVLETTAAWLLHETGPAPTQQALADLPRARRADVTAPRRSEMPEDIPVFGTAAGSVEGSFILGGVIDYVRRPPGIARASDVYAIFVVGTSMEPEHPHGELRFVSPHKPPRPGDTVVVQTGDPDQADVEGYIARLVRQLPAKITLGKLNPAKTLELRKPPAFAVHKVLTMNELFGI